MTLAITSPAWLDRAGRQVPPFLLIADPSAVRRAAALFGAADAVAECEPHQAGALFTT